MCPTSGNNEKKKEKDKGNMKEKERKDEPS
jgi:hypothetical protein